MPLPTDRTGPSGRRTRKHRVADVQLRGPAPRVRASLHCPTGAGSPTRPPLVVLFADTGSADEAAEVALVDHLVELLGAVVLSVAAGHAIEAHTAAEWAADHAAELGSDPQRLVLVGAGSGAALAERVAALVAGEGWPPLLHVGLLWPHDDPTAVIDELAHALADPAATADPRRTR